MKISLFFGFLLVSVSSYALDCDVIVYTDQEVVEQSFTAPLESQGHNVPEQTVKGKYNEITVMADGKWLGINWNKGQELIAESVSLIQKPVTQPRVLIVYNPKNRDEQVSINCQ